VHAGEISLDSHIASEVVKAFSAPLSGCSQKPLLTDREMEVVQLIAHMLKIFDKVGVYDRVELMLYAIHHGLIDKPDGPMP
jgi:DNA-binding NarL/FixJ family response regulator